MALDGNPIGNHGVAALAAPLRTLPALELLGLVGCEVSDAGVASLFANLGKDDFRALARPAIARNRITDGGMVTLLAALEAGGLPKLVNHYIDLLADNPASAAAVTAVHDALVKRRSQ